MAKKKEEFKLPPGTPAPWMSTFSDLMTLLMCFFVLLFASSSVDVAKFDAIAQSFQQTFSIFKGGAKAIGDGILISNGVSQLNELDRYINSTGAAADHETDSEQMQQYDDSFIEEENVFYDVMKWEKSIKDTPYSDVEKEFGPLNIVKRPEKWLKYWNKEIDRLDRVISENALPEVAKEKYQSRINYIKGVIS